MNTEIEVFDAVGRILRSNGFDWEPGRIEFYPQASFRRPDGTMRDAQRLRVPFGLGTTLLDPVDLVPIALPGVRGLAKARHMFVGDFISRVDVEALTDEVKQLGARGRPRAKKRLTQRGASYRLADLGRLDEIGLERSGQLHAALLTKAVDYRLRNLTLDEATTEINRWLDANHNGVSRTYNRDPGEARARAAETLWYVYSHWKAPASNAAGQTITAFETALIVAATDASPMTDLIDPETGQKVPRIKVQKLIHHVVVGMKEWVYRQCVRAAEAVQRRHRHVPVGSPEFDSFFLTEVSWFWPSPPFPLFIVQNPYAFRRAIGGISEAAMAASWRIAKETRLFIPYRKASAAASRAESFVVMLDFDCMSEWGTSSASWSVAVLKQLTPSEIRERYSPYYVAQIMHEGRDIMPRAFPTEAVSDIQKYVSWRLKAASVRSATASSTAPASGSLSTEPGDDSCTTVVTHGSRVFSDSVTTAQPTASADTDQKAPPPMPAPRRGRSMVPVPRSAR